jgi:hypothetical protein
MTSTVKDTKTYLLLLKKDKELKVQSHLMIKQMDIQPYNMMSLKYQSTHNLRINKFS